MAQGAYDYPYDDPEAGGYYDELDAQPFYDEEPIESQKCCSNTCKVVIVFIVIFTIRLIILVTFFSFWAINVILKFAFETNGYVPAEQSSLWKVTRAGHNNVSLLDEYAFPNAISKGLTKYDAILRDRLGFEISMLLRTVVASTYCVDLFLCCLLAVLGFVLAKKSICVAKLCFGFWIFFMVFCLLGYIFGFFFFMAISEYFTVLWADIILNLMLFIIIVMRLCWLRYLSKMGVTKTGKNNAVGPAAYNKYNDQGSYDPQNEADHDRVFGGGVNSASTYSMNTTGMAPSNPSVGSGPYTSSGETGYDSVPSSATTQSTMPSGDTNIVYNITHGPGGQQKPNTVEKQTKTTIVMVGKKGKKNKKKKSKKKKKKKSKKKKKKE